MKNSKHYFKIGHYAYHGTNMTFLIDCTHDPWRLFCKKGPHTHYQFWKPIPCDGLALKEYIQEIARPNIWKQETHSFRKKHQEKYSCDGARIETEWNFGNGIERRMYSSGCTMRGCWWE